MELEYKVMKELLAEQKITNELLREQNELLRGVIDGKLDQEQSEPKTIRKRGPNRNRQ